MVLILVCLRNWLWGLHHSPLLSMFLWSCTSPCESLDQVGQRIAVIYSIMLACFFPLFLSFFPWILLGFLPAFFPSPSLFLIFGLFKMGLELTTDSSVPQLMVIHCPQHRKSWHYRNAITPTLFPFKTGVLGIFKLIN